MPDRCALPHCRKAIGHEDKSYIILFCSSEGILAPEAVRICADCGIKLMQFNEEKLETALEEVLATFI